MHSLGTTCLDVLLKVSIQTAALAVIVWAITRLASKAPAAWRNALWLVVVVKFLVPPFAYYPSQLAFWQAPASQVASAGPADGQIPAPAAAVPEPAADAGRSAMSYPESAAPVAMGSRVEPVTSPRPALTPGSVLPWAWLAGVSAMLALVALRFARQVRLVRGSSAASTDLTDLLREAAACLGVKRLPDLRISPDAATPMLVGYFRPVILLPRGISESCRASDLKAMLLHELAHIKRRDIAAIWLQQLAQALFYFHPAVWLAGREIRKERELACDELVLSKSAIPAKDYAAGYVSALKLANGSRAFSTSLAMAEPLDMEKMRLAMILRSAVPKLSARWIAAFALVAAVGLPTFAGLAKTVTAAEIAKALNDQEAACGGSLVVHSEMLAGVGKTNARFSTTYVRTPKVLWAQEKYGSTVSTASYDRKTGEYRRLSVQNNTRYADQATYAEVSSRASLPFDTQSFVETTRYAIFEGTLGELIGRGKVAERPEDIDGYSCLRVEIPSAGNTFRRFIVWVDPEIGFSPRKVEIDWKDAEPQIVTFKGYREVGAGVWFPTEHAVEFIEKSGGTVRTENKVTRAEIGREYAKDGLIVKFPMGTQVHTGLHSSFIWRGRVERFPAAAKKIASAGKPQAKELQDARMLAGLTAVEGPGVIVTLRDSPKLSRKETRPDVRANYLVHDSDVRSIVNELFASGAEAISVSGQRIVATSSIRCVGPSMMVNSVAIRVPVEIRAIGQADVLEKVLKLPGGVAESLMLLDMVQVTKKTRLTVPAYKGKTRFDLARPAAATQSGEHPASPSLTGSPPEETAAPSLRSAEVVLIAGPVARPGVYAMSRDEKLIDLIERAGGLTKSATPRGVLLLRGRDWQQDREADARPEQSRAFAEKQLLTQWAKLGIGLPGWATLRSEAPP